MQEKPRVTVLTDEGMKEIPWEELPEPEEAIELVDYFKPVRISPAAIDQASRMVPAEHWIKDGLYTWLSKRADFVFSKLPTTERVGRLRSLKYEFSFDANSPVLDRISLINN